jgi:hypothetical protein
VSSKWELANHNILLSATSWLLLLPFCAEPAPKSSNATETSPSTQTVQFCAMEDCENFCLEGIGSDGQPYSYQYCGDHVWQQNEAKVPSFLIEMKKY